MGLLGRLWTWLVRPPSLRDAETGEDDPGAGSDDEPVVMPIEESIDLHHFAPRDIPSVVDEYLREARARGFREVRVIHGRGKGVQRQRVQRQLERHPSVQSFRSDGLGSTLAVLRPPRAAPARRGEG